MDEMQQHVVTKGTLPFGFHPVFFFNNLTDALFHSFRPHCSNLPSPVVVDHGWYFGGTADEFICGKSTLAVSKINNQ